VAETPTPDPSASWIAPDAIRLPLLAARAALKDAEDTLTDIMAGYLRDRIERAPPVDRLNMLQGLSAQYAAEGDTDAPARLAAAWSDCEAAYAGVVWAERAYSDGLPPDIGLSVVVSPQVFPIHEDESPC
jgi:hypothetical protein